MSGLPIAAPEDFDQFWAEAYAEANAFPLDYKRSLTNDFAWPGFVVERIDFAVLGGRVLHGWIAYPPNARRLPGFLWIPPYGRESLLPNEYGTREGFVSLSFNFFGHEAFHQEKYVMERGYFAERADDPSHYVLRQMMQDTVIAAKVLQAQNEVDETRIGSMGMSQGAGMSIWLGALSPVIKAVCADMPFWGAIAETLSGDVYRYPLKELIDYMETIPVGRERVLNTVRYFDTAFFAERCSIPTQVSMGLKDPSVRPPNAQAIFDALPGEKALRIYDWGHDWHTDMIENNRQWLLEHLRG